MPCKHTSWRHVRATDADRSLNAALFRRATINSPSHPTLRHATPTEALECPLRLALTYGWALTWRAHPTLRQVESAPNYSEEAPSLQSEQPRPATRRPLRQHGAAPLQCALMDSDAREDVPVANTVTLTLFSLFAPPPCVYKRERRATVTRADEPNPHTQGLGLDTLSRPVCNPYYKQP
jgi:hypothetical protein